MPKATSTPTVSQKRREAAVAAEATSKASFRKAQRMIPRGTMRLAAFAAQAQIYLDTMGELGLIDHPDYAVLVRQGRGNLAAYARATAVPAAEATSAA